LKERQGNKEVKRWRGKETDRLTDRQRGIDTKKNFVMKRHVHGETKRPVLNMNGVEL
jgi:hypothetical protein